MLENRKKTGEARLESILLGVGGGGAVPRGETGVIGGR